MQQITLWYRFNKSSNSFDYNHFDFGFSSDSFPSPKHHSFSSQKSWSSFKWKKSFAFLHNNIILNEFSS